MPSDVRTRTNRRPPTRTIFIDPTTSSDSRATTARDTNAETIAGLAWITSADIFDSFDEGQSERAFRISQGDACLNREPSGTRCDVAADKPPRPDSILRE